MLAGISAEYYLRLEQGRDRHPSDQVLDGIARALQLEDDAASYMHNLARHSARSHDGEPSARTVDPALQDLIDSWPLISGWVNGITIATMGLAEPLERAAELEQLSALLIAARSGRGQVCVVEGPGGVGKTRLLDHCAGTAESLGVHVLRARCSEFARDYPFGVARSLFEAGLMRAEEGMRAKLMRGPAALAEPIFGHEEASDEFGVIHGLYWLTVNLAEQHPIAILVDDIPWADDFSLRFLAYIAERLDDVPVALVVAIRSGDPGAESQPIGHLRDAASSPPIRPAELSEAAVEALLAHALPGRDVDGRLARAVMRDTGGNPFLVVAVADAIGAGEDTELTSPDSVRRNIARRLARLDPTARDLAKAASVLGDDAAFCDAVRVAGLQPDSGLAAAEELLGAQVFATADPILFAHRIIRTTVHSMLEPRERPMLHVRAAKVLVANRAPPRSSPNT